MWTVFSTVMRLHNEPSFVGGCFTDGVEFDMQPIEVKALPLIVLDWNKLCSLLCLKLQPIPSVFDVR